jgi:hypothetical protein
MKESSKKSEATLGNLLQDRDGEIVGCAVWARPLVLRTSSSGVSLEKTDHFADSLLYLGNLFSVLLQYLKK